MTEGAPYTKAVDIYLLGELLLYTILQDHPALTASSFIQNSSSEILFPAEQCRSLLIEHLSQVLGSDTHPVVQLVVCCLQSEPGKRPTASVVLKELNEGWVQAECQSEQALKWGSMVSMNMLGSQFQVGKARFVSNLKQCTNIILGVYFVHALTLL